MVSEVQDHRSRIQDQRSSANVTARQTYFGISVCTSYQECNSLMTSNQGSYVRSLTFLSLFMLSASLIDHFLFICCLSPHLLLVTCETTDIIHPFSSELDRLSMIMAPAELSTSATLSCSHLCTLNGFTATRLYATGES